MSSLSKFQLIKLNAARDENIAAIAVDLGAMLSGPKGDEMRDRVAGSGYPQWFKAAIAGANALTKIEKNHQWDGDWIEVIEDLGNYLAENPYATEAECSGFLKTRIEIDKDGFILRRPKDEATL